MLEKEACDMRNRKIAIPAVISAVAITIASAVAVIVRKKATKRMAVPRQDVE